MSEVAVDSEIAAGTDPAQGNISEATVRRPERAITFAAVLSHLELSAFLAAMCLGAWMILFVCGTFVNASDLINGALADKASVSSAIQFCSGVMCWTWTNLLMLCIMSAFLGGIARSWDQNLNYRRIQFDALTTGFIIFLLFMFEESLTGGRLAGKIDPDEAQSTYVRLAIVASLLSFTASYRPEFYKSLLARFTNSQSPATDSASSTSPNKPR